MKRKFWRELEKVVSSAKKHWKEIVTAIALPFIFKNNVEGLVLRVENRSDDVPYEEMRIAHISGATEGYDGNYDVSYDSGGSPNPLHIYSHNTYCNRDFFVDARGPDSTTTYNLELLNKTFTRTANNMLRFIMKDGSNFTWKNIFLGDANDSNDTIADIKYVIAHGGVYPPPYNNIHYGDFPLPDVDGSKTGVYDKRKVFFFNYADFNHDRLIDGLDFKIFRENFNRNNETDPNTFGSYVGSDVNNYNAYADINRSSGVDYDDLNIFKSYFRFPGDLNLDGRVDNTDFAHLADNWNVGDANFYDLSSFSSDYLRDINDPSTWQSKLTPSINGESVLDSRHLREFQRDAAERFYGKNEVPYLREERETA